MHAFQLCDEIDKEGLNQVRGGGGVGEVIVEASGM